MTSSDKVKAQDAKSQQLKLSDKYFHYAKLHVQTNHQTGSLFLLPTACKIGNEKI